VSAVIIRASKLDRLFLTDTALGTDEGMTYKGLRELLVNVYGFDIEGATKVLNLARTTPAILVDLPHEDGTVNYRLIENKQKQFNANQLFGKLFNTVAKTNAPLDYSAGIDAFAVDDFSIQPSDFAGGKKK